MSARLDQLITPVPEERALNAIIAMLRELKFNTTSWQNGSAQLTVFRAIARMGSGFIGTAQGIVRGLIFGLSTGAWLRLIGDWYQLPIQEAVAARVQVRLTSAASAPAHNIPVGAPLTIGGRAFTLETAPGLFSAGSSAVFVAVARTPGQAGTPTLAETCAWVNPYPGVTIAQEALAAPSDDTAVLTIGSDVESDERYTHRLELRWAELTYAVGVRAYELWALTACPTITQAKVLNNYPTPNAVRVVLRNATGPATPGEVAMVAAAMTDARRAINDIVTVSAAVAYPQAFVLNPRIRAGGATAAQCIAAIEATALALPIGGVKIAGSAAGYILRDSYIVAAGQLPGVASVGLATPPTDVLLGGTDVVIPTVTCTPEYFAGAV